MERLTLHDLCATADRIRSRHADAWSGKAGAPIPMNELRAFQASAHQAFFEAVDSIMDGLAGEEPIKPAASTHAALAGAALARASRRAGHEAKERRDFAQMLLIGALLNHDNPDWNPADPSTDRANHDDPFVLLLQMDLTEKT